MERGFGGLGRSAAARRWHRRRRWPEGLPSAEGTKASLPLRRRLHHSAWDRRHPADSECGRDARSVRSAGILPASQSIARSAAFPNNTISKKQKRAPRFAQPMDCRRDACATGSTLRAGRPRHDVSRNHQPNRTGCGRGCGIGWLRGGGWIGRGRWRPGRLSCGPP